MNRSNMKSLPPSERPYEKCRERGPSFLSDAELLSLILRTGTRNLSSLQLAEELLRRFGGQSGLGFLMEVNRPELESLPGIGPVKASELLAAGEISRRIAGMARGKSVRMCSPQSIADYFMEDMCHLDHEELHAAMFNSKHRLVHRQMISVGTVNASLASPREIFRTALRFGAVYLVLLHNHPSGDPQPSRADILHTKDFLEAGRLLDVPVEDHIVIGDHCYVSMRESGLVDFR